MRHGSLLGDMFITGNSNSQLSWVEMFHRQNTRLYDIKGQGAPEDWCTEEGQGEPKIMVFHAIYGGGLVFGPFPIVNRPYNSAEYIRSSLNWGIWIFIIHRMLREDILPEIQAVLGPRRWQRCIFQQVWIFNLHPSLILPQGRGYNTHFQCCLGFPANCVWWQTDDWQAEGWHDGLACQQPWLV